MDNGLADAVVVIFLENNHGKYVADMLFGQFQTKRKRSTVIGIDSMLAEFEGINKRVGTVRGYAINPMASVDFGVVLGSLGYRKTPDPLFNFNRRNVHFAAACAPHVKDKLNVDLRKLLGVLLPDVEGVVRISSNRPTEKDQAFLPLPERFIDVPACVYNVCDGNVTVPVFRGGLEEPPLSVPMDKKFYPGGNGVVPFKTATDIGYMGIKFSRQKACAEIGSYKYELVREAWPRDYYSRFGNWEGPPISGAEMKCAPVNWVVRAPNSHFTDDNGYAIPRYPPRSFQNALYKRGPRDERDWIPTATYEESPFRSGEETSAKAALTNLMSKVASSNRTPNMLDVLREVYADMGDRDPSDCDRWLQRKVTIPPLHAFVKCEEDMRLYNAREDGRPRQPITVKEAFKSSAATKQKVSEVRANDPTDKRTTS